MIIGIMKSRDIGATDIQRLWRARIARELGKKEKDKVVFVWDQDGKTVDISVRIVENDGGPKYGGRDTPEEVDARRSATPWQDPVRMKWCRSRKCFVHAVPRRIAEYDFKFFVHGGDRPRLHPVYPIQPDPDHPTDMRRRFNAIQIKTTLPRAGGNGADDQGQGQGGPSASSASEAAAGSSVDATTEEQPESEGPQPQAATTTGQPESPTPQGPPTTLPATSSAASIQESVAPSTTAGEG
ncbi:unnamed protein product [Vitrella brassicaformis CCMP3155]|uniref:Uncharacterized protein n=1 Tax=Vitrella brassicaformis (strain CCMP3155) TaxID=1169540 RepID=A0A0G4FRU5_VITBC|nr:unnamed protein product [Vitrella brassicaformis CCMP3155]|eukprot:CEM17392.1 unnamed protein product [Vitrella brassicaformis CCMP3155]